jgi:8-oxo-dGTP pyrophosphatase MutT (NUDIX family)
MHVSRTSNRSARELRALIEHRLLDTHPSTDPAQARFDGRPGDIDPLLVKLLPPAPLAAAVLVPIVDRGDELTVLLTQRSSTLRTHAGQVSFPGGRIEPDDGSPLEAALRETEEEIGLAREFITLAGYLDPQLVLSGFWVTPVVAFVKPGFTLQVDHREVDDTFEVPLEFILDPVNHTQRERLFGGTTVPFYEIRHGDRYIWGATAAMLVTLYRQIEVGSR